MKFAVLGAGMMGTGAIFDLIQQNDVESLIVCDAKESNLTKVTSKFPDDRLKIMQGDLADRKFLNLVLSEADVALGCVSYKMNRLFTEAAIANHCHFVDLGGNNDVVAKQLSMNSEAEKAGITVVPDCGLAPGMGNVLVAHAADEFDMIEEAHIRVGGLPQNPEPPLNYELVFSAEGLINEYVEPALVLREGQLMQVESLTEIEELEFPEPFGRMEAFHTSGGVSTLVQTFATQIKTLDYKTIRYPGHAAIINGFKALGFLDYEVIEISGTHVTLRSVLEAALIRKLRAGTKDVILMRIEIMGLQNGQTTKRIYQMIDYADEQNDITAMMRTTAFPAVIIALMLGRKQIRRAGVFPSEIIVPGELYLDELAKRGIKIKISEKKE